MLARRNDELSQKERSIFDGCVLRFLRSELDLLATSATMAEVKERLIELGVRFIYCTPHTECAYWNAYRDGPVTEFSPPLHRTPGHQMDSNLFDLGGDNHDTDSDYHRAPGDDNPKTMYPPQKISMVKLDVTIFPTPDNYAEDTCIHSNTTTMTTPRHAVNITPESFQVLLHENDANGGT
jgi:hypothetical protein